MALGAENMTRVELESLGWTDAKLDELYIMHVSDVSSVDHLALRAETPEAQRLRRERFNAVCAAVYDTPARR